MKRKHPLTHFLLALACSISGGIADDAPAPAVPAPPVLPHAPVPPRPPGLLNVPVRPLMPAQPGAAGNARIQIQGGAAVQIQGGGRVQLQFGNVQIQGAVTVVQADANAAPGTEPPAFFLPGFPTVVIPNTIAKPNSKAGYLGLILDTAPVAEDDPTAKDKNNGVGIGSIIDDSPAAKAGLKEGDQVLTFEGKKAKDSTQLREMIRTSQPEQNVKLTVRRDEKEIEIKAKLATAPDAGAARQILGGAAFMGQNVPEAVPGVVKFGNTVVRNGVVIRNGVVVSSTGSSAAKNSADDTDTVTLRDGNVFTGKIRGITAEKGLQLQREGLGDLDLIEEEITSLALAERKSADAADTAKGAAPLPKVIVQMRDGSVFHGDALTMENGALQLTLPGGQRIGIPREHAQFATLSDGDAARIFDGPTGLSGWTSGRYQNGQWEYKGGFLRCITNGPIGRDLGRMPDPVDVSFDIIYPAQMQHFSFVLFSADVNQSGVGALTLQFSPQQIMGTHYDGQRSNQYSTVPPQNAQQGVAFNAGDKPATIHYRLLVDRVNGRALIYVNGDKRADWKLSKVKAEDLGKSGAAFGITPHVSMGGVTFQIGRVRVLPWDGKEPKKEAERAEPKGDQVLASNGTLTDGTLDRITDSEVIFANPEAKAKREKTLFVRFAAPAAPKDLAPAVALARMKNGSEVSATQVRGSGDALTLTTRCGPEVTVPLAALRGLEYFPRAGQADVTSKNLDILTLTDGTQLAGKALLPFAEKGVSWKIAASKTPLDFPSAKIAGVVFRSTEGDRKSSAMKGDSALRMANGDWLQGSIVSLDGKQLVMKSDLAPALNVPLSELRALYLNPSVVTTLSDGASGPELWTEGWNPNRASNVMSASSGVAVRNSEKTGRTWSYHDGSYSPTGARNSQPMLAKHWPGYEGAYAISFDIISSGRTPYFSAQIYNSKDERTFSITASGTRLYVYFNPGFSRVNRVGAAPKNIQIENKSETTGDRIRVSLIMDRPAKTFRVIMGGKEVGKIAFKGDEAKEALDACGFSLQPMSFGTATGRAQNRIEHMWLAPWSGTAAPLAAAPDKEKAANADPKKDPAPDAEKKDAPESMPTIFLSNGDEFSGTIEKLTSELVTVNSDAGPLELPGKRIAWIRFPGGERPPADHFPRLRFHDRGLLSVNDLQVTDSRVKCKTLDGQPLDFPISVVKEVVWRPLGEK